MPAKTKCLQLVELVDVTKDIKLTAQPCPLRLTHSDSDLVGNHLDVNWNC